MRFVTLCLCAAASLLPALAGAESPPSLWARVASPERARLFELHRAVREKLASPEAEVGQLFGKPFAYDSARLMLEDAEVEKLGDPQLLFDYGEVLEMLDEHEKAITVLTRAMAMAPSHPAVDDASLTLAFAYAKLDRSEEELEYYRKFVRSSRNVRGLSTAMLNMAEAEMRLGRLSEAISGYREANRLASEAQTASSSHETAALACYGLAVALDRQGDPATARVEMQRALSMDPTMMLLLSSPNVFFVPAYERSYYVAMGFEARARDESTPERVRAEFLRRSIASYKEYVTRARPDDRWVHRAREHLTDVSKWGHATWGKDLQPREKPDKNPFPSEREITF